MAISAWSGLKSPYPQMIAPGSALFESTARRGSASPPGSMHTCPTISGILFKTQAVDVLQADGTRCGGVSNFLGAADVCEMFHYPLSAHTSPSLHATLCCALTPAMNVEYFYDHYRIEQMIFDGAIVARNGMLTPDQTRPGLGLQLKEADAAQYRISRKSIQ